LTLRVGAGYGWRTAEAEVGNLLANPDIGGIVLNLRDVTERQALEDQLRFQALHDPLTGCRTASCSWTGSSARSTVRARDRNGSPWRASTWTGSSASTTASAAVRRTRR
jgi:hypothetical protein